MKAKVSLFASLLAAAAISSCSQYQQQGAMVGALGGAALGAITGDETRDVVKGAAIGAAVGAGAAAVKESADNRNTNYNAGRQYGTPTQAQYPYARRAQQAGYVYSPYKPYNLIDVRGIPSGKMAKEPGTNNIFLIP